ncbi:uncharacterized protein LOC122498347 isoform X2 [Leptopilina heterotoma]|uniref:uncharacterized protein LOC122498347 isoform X2 n=1 Tax=Leptopilina heterotoma TaxID=63436 RepID=UPI001CA8F64B|nr:uncharacterized protein LOC122498347 isoform X2 [Leptopilina heterotoma]
MNHFSFLILTVSCIFIIPSYADQNTAELNRLIENLTAEKKYLEEKIRDADSQNSGAATKTFMSSKIREQAESNKRGWEQQHKEVETMIENLQKVKEKQENRKTTQRPITSGKEGSSCMNTLATVLCSLFSSLCIFQYLLYI